ncbi:MAG: sensor histidine kinase [Sphingomonas sp.]
MRASRTQMLLIATAMVWLIAYAAWTADWMFGDMAHVVERSLRRIPLCLFGAVCCWGMRAVLDRTAARPLGSRLVTALGLCVAASLAYSGLNAWVYYGIAPLWGPTNLGEILQLAMVVAWVFFAWSALYFGIDADARAHETRTRLAEVEAAALRARNQALAQQISPHFLFNALNTVSGLILDGEPARAERVTMALAGLLRRSLESDARDRVPLAEELDAVRRYLAIEETRFEDRLRVVERVPPALGSLAVPPMILQPLVENPVKHGVARSTVPVTLTIAAALADGRLMVTIDDDAPSTGPSAPGTGIGQRNVRQRLALLYGDVAAFDCGSRSGGGYSVRLVLPAETHDAA